MANSEHEADVERLAHHGVGSPRDEDHEVAEKEKKTSSISSDDGQAGKTTQMSLLHECLFIATMCSAQFTTQVGLTQALGILDRIGSSFNVTNPGVLSWFIAGYSLTAGTFILVAGRIGDLFGYKRVFILGMLWFAIWSMVAGLSVYSNHYLFIFARVLQGLGPAALLPNALALLGVTYPPD
ncbi:MFS general substrate transporter [Apiospora arundinis]